MLGGKRSVVLLSGAGTSVAYDAPSTPRATQLAERSLCSNEAMKQQRGGLHLYASIRTLLSELLGDENAVNFEHVYQAITDASVFLNPVDDRSAIEAKPIVTATHVLRPGFRRFNRQAYYATLDTCTDLIIAGYGFGDYHVNERIRSLRNHRPEVRTYLVDREENQCPDMYFDQECFPPQRSSTLNVLNENVGLDEVRPLDGREGWFLVKRVASGARVFPPMGVWLGGWASFCRDVVVNGLPDLPTEGA